MNPLHPAPSDSHHNVWTGSHNHGVRPPGVIGGRVSLCGSPEPLWVTSDTPGPRGRPAAPEGHSRVCLLGRMTPGYTIDQRPPTSPWRSDPQTICRLGRFTRRPAMGLHPTPSKPLGV